MLRLLSTRRLTPWLGLFVLALLVVGWLAFFDSHSLAKRIAWHREYAELTEENAALRRDIEALEEKLREPPSDALIEEIAREQYGMRRPGETVYRIEKGDIEKGDAPEQ